MLGSFEQWCSWVRDPLVALGCRDPADRIDEVKERDGHRQSTGELFTVWWTHHAGEPVSIRDLHEEVRDVLDPQGRSRQFQSSRLEKLSGTRLAGFVLTRQASTGKWGAATYALKRTDEPEIHRDHRAHEPSGTDAPDGPYAQGLSQTIELIGSRRCSWCRDPDTAAQPLGQYLDGSGGDVWLHQQCWPSWANKREC